MNIMNDPINVVMLTKIIEHLLGMT